jgi:hypothetical protein
MCYEERFFSEWAAKRAQQREKTKPVRQPAPPSAQPVRPTPETKKHKEAEREPEIA